MIYLKCHGSGIAWCISVKRQRCILHNVKSKHNPCRMCKECYIDILEHTDISNIDDTPIFKDMFIEK